MKMKQVTIQIEDYLYEFYQKIGIRAGGLPPEKVMADTLFLFAGKVSEKALREKDSSYSKE